MADRVPKRSRQVHESHCSSDTSRLSTHSANNRLGSAMASWETDIQGEIQRYLNHDESIYRIVDCRELLSYALRPVYRHILATWGSGTSLLLEYLADSTAMNKIIVVD